MKDGRCPSCGKDPSNLEGVDTSRRSLTIDFKEKLPPACFNCGKDTDKTVGIHGKKGTSMGFLSFLLYVVTFPILGLWSILFINEMEKGSRYSHLSRRLPVCPDCRKTANIAPEHTDYERYKFTYIVHRVFYDRVQANRND